jgi:hypothetical protein
VTSLADVGMSIETTRALIQCDAQTARRLLSTRLCIAVALIFLSSGAMLIVGPPLNLTLWLVAAPYVIADTARSHVFSCIRASGRTSFELRAGPLASAFESACLATTAFITGSVLLSLAVWAAASALTTTAILVWSRAKRYQTPFGITRPCVPWAAIRRGNETFILGLMPKLLGLVTVTTIGTTGARMAWALTSLRALDNLYGVATILTVVPNYTRAAAGHSVRLSRGSLSLLALGPVGVAVAAPGVVLLRVPGLPELVLSGLLGAAVFGWLICNWQAHMAHAAARGTSQAHSISLATIAGAAILGSVTGDLLGTVGAAAGGACIAALSSHAVGRRRVCVNPRDAN